MKKFFFVCVFMLTLGLLSSPVFALQYCKDFLESCNPGGSLLSFKTFDESYTVGVGETFEIDIWLNDVPQPLISGGVYLLMDSTLGTVTDIVVADGNEQPGQWDSGATSETPNPSGLGSYVLTIGQFAGDGAEPDADGDILIGTATVESFSEGGLQIAVSIIPTPGYDTWMDWDGTVYDSQIAPNTITILQYG